MVSLSAPLAPLTVHLGKTIPYTVTGINSKNFYTTSVNLNADGKIPSTITSGDNIIVSASKSDCLYVGTHSASFSLFDTTDNQESIYYFDILVVNDPPAFSTPLSTLDIYLNDPATSFHDLPSISDTEGHTIASVTVTSDGPATLV